MFRDYLINNRFYPQAKALRNHFDEQMAPSSISHQSRFVWDYWYHENKYVHFRTPALHYFPKKLMGDFTSHLIEWGQKTLGCNSITAPWLSYYIDGCKQELHGDIPHGPWAYVFSLTLNPKLFTGGDTLILKDPILNYWNNVEAFDGLDHDKIFESIRPEFNRLLVFDGRIPHGVSQVQGPRNPTHGRIVLHGWFTEPSPYIEGPLNIKSASKTLNKLINQAQASFDQLGHFSGTISLKINVSKTGEIQKIAPLVSSLKSAQIESSEINNSILKIIKSSVRALTFAPASSNTQITLPLIFSNKQK